MKKSNEAIATAFAQMKMNEEKDFEKEFKNAFHKFKTYKQDAESYKTLNKKAEFLQKYMDKITRLLHKAKHNYNIYYDDFDDDQMSLIDLRNEIENYINELYEAARSTSTKKEKKKPEFKEFFNGLNDDQINAIHQKFIGYGGKNLAILIDLLYNEHKALKFEKSSKTGLSRKNFIELFERGTYNAANKEFDKQTLDYCVYDGDDDEKINIRKELKSIIKTP